MKNLQEKLNVKIPTDNIYISSTMVNNKEHLNYFLMSTEGSKFMKLTGENAGEVYIIDHFDAMSYNAGKFNIGIDDTLSNIISSEKIKYSTLLKLWSKENNRHLRKEKKLHEKEIKEIRKTEENKHIADEFFK